MRHYEALVVGSGVMGAAVSYNLSRRGLKVLTLERFGLNHEFGSSHGKTRIIRLAYFEDPRYVPLLRRAFQAWQEVESASGRRLLTMTGGLMIGAPEGRLVRGVLRSAREHGLQHQVYSASELNDSLDALTVDDDFVAVRETKAGILFAEECTRSFVELAEESGCEFRFTEPLSRWKATKGGVEVETSGGTYAADRVVFCAGPWTSELLGGLIPLTCERQTPFWFPSYGQECFRTDRMPVFILEEKSGRFFYGIPDVGDGVKVAVTHEGEVVDPNNAKRKVTEEDASPVKDFVSRRMKRLGRSPISSTTCLYSNTPDLNFAIGTHPDYDRVMVVCACSGHGFKFACVLGEVVADLVTKGKAGFDISFLDLQRFGRN